MQVKEWHFSDSFPSPIHTQSDTRPPATRICVVNTLSPPTQRRKQTATKQADKPTHLRTQTQTLNVAAQPTNTKQTSKQTVPNTHLFLSRGLEGDCRELTAEVLEPLLRHVLGYQVDFVEQQNDPLVGI